MQPLTTTSTIEEIEQAGEFINQAFQSNREYIKALEETNELQRKLLEVNQKSIDTKDKHIAKLEKQLEEVMDLAVRATALASKNVI